MVYNLFDCLSAALKGGCQCFVSMNIADESVRLLAEEHISELCVKHPELFSFW